RASGEGCRGLRAARPDANQRPIAIRAQALDVPDGGASREAERYVAWERTTVERSKWGLALPRERQYRRSGTKPMKAIRLHARAKPMAFVYEDTPKPEPGEGEVLIAVHAAAVTPTELEWAPTWTTRAGEPRPLPIILGHEFSGEIRSVGSGVTDLAPGDAVFGMNDWFRD